LFLFFLDFAIGSFCTSFFKDGITQAESNQIYTLKLSS
jgi:hypothetical protein